MLDRRALIKRAGELALLSHLPGAVLAGNEGEARFVVVILRGALDGLAAVPPIGDPDYRRLRGELAIAAPGEADGAHALDDLFALHPVLVNMLTMFEKGELAIVHAAATPYRERSHFDGQKVLENGGTAAGSPRDGWLNRALALLEDPLGEGGRALALAQNLPLILRGDASATSWAPSRLPAPGDDLLERVADLYADDAVLSARLAQALEAREMASGLESDGPGARRDLRQPFGQLVAAAGRFLSAPDGPRIAVLESGGWDTHANQGAGQGLLATRLRGLDAGLAALRRELGQHWNETAVLVVTEFGRTVAVNGTRGTDHGTGTCAFLAGGAVAGGRVIADWPGLRESRLLEDRDLRPSVDLRSIFKGVLREHLGFSDEALETHVFPGTADLSAVEGLIVS